MNECVNNKDKGRDGSGICWTGVELRNEREIGFSVVSAQLAWIADHAGLGKGQG